MSEARSIRLASQTLTFARTRWKAGYFGRRWRKLCTIMRFALKFSSNATLIPSVAARLKQSTDDLKRGYRISDDRRRQRVDHGAQSKSSLHLLRCLCSDSRWNFGKRTVALQFG